MPARAWLRLLPLALALLAGAWLRWDGLWWGFRDGLPRLYHPDERRLAETALALEKGEPFPPGYVLGQPQLVRALSPACDDVASRILNARGASLLAGLALVAVCAGLARQIGASAAAGASLAALNTLCIIHSHFGTADMLYAALLAGFALAALSGRLFAAAACAGLAMSVKFGVVLLPSLLWLAARHRGRGAAALGVAAFALLAAQGFAFDAEAVRAMWRSFAQDNAGGFAHDKWMNLPVYAAVLVRALGIPVFLLALWGLASLRRPAPAGAIALLPFALHGLGLLLLHASFPRHALPLVPPLLALAALGCARLPAPARGAVAALALAWSGALAWSDGRAFAVDPRERAAAWMAQNLPREAPVWCDPFWHGPAWTTPAARPSAAAIFVLNEAWTWRFERSEVNPLRAPDAAHLYHAEAGDLAWYGRVQAARAAGELEVLYAAGPAGWLPEQRLYRRAWGSFEKFAGEVRVLASRRRP